MQLVPSKHAGAIVGAIDDVIVGAIVGALVGVGVAITLTTNHHCTVCDPNGKDVTVRFHNARCLEDTNRDVMVKLPLKTLRRRPKPRSSPYWFCPKSVSDTACLQIFWASQTEHVTKCPASPTNSRSLQSLDT